MFSTWDMWRPSWRNFTGLSWFHGTAATVPYNLSTCTLRSDTHMWSINDTVHTIWHFRGNRMTSLQVIRQVRAKSSILDTDHKKHLLNDRCYVISRWGTRVIYILKRRHDSVSFCCLWNGIRHGAVINTPRAGNWPYNTHVAQPRRFRGNKDKLVEFIQL